MSRPGWQLRDAAVGYASRGIPVLPLHYPFTHHGGLQPVPGDQQPVVRTGCSCRDPNCGQPAKHPLGSLVPHGVKDATTNRARILAWWTRHPQANIGLATGHRFDVLDVDGPKGAHAIQELAPPTACTAPGRWSAPAGVAGTTARVSKEDAPGGALGLVLPLALPASCLQVDLSTSSRGRPPAPPAPTV